MNRCGKQIRASRRGAVALCALLAAAPSVASAAPKVKVNLSVRPKRGTVSDVLTLQVEVRVVSEQGGGGGFLFGRTQPYRDYRPPRGMQSDFEVNRQWTSQSQQISIIGGRAQRETIHTYHYLIRPRRTGRISIGPAEVKVKGRRYRSGTIAVNIGGAPPAPPPLSPGQTPNLSGDEEMFVQVVPDKTGAWVGEQVTVTWYLYVKSSLARQPTIKKQPQADHFIAESLPIGSAKMTHATINGNIYGRMPIYRKALFPMKAGRLEIGPLTAEALTVGSSYYSLTPVRGSSAPVYIQAKALPSAGAPPGFDPSNVGDFRVRTVVDPATFDARRATSLKVIVEGTGYIHGIKPKKLGALPGFKVRFAGQRTEPRSSVLVGGKRIHEYVLIPAQTGTLKIPPICFPHFSTTRGSFVSSTCSAPLQVVVTGSLPSSSGGGSGAGATNLLRRRIKPILSRSSLPHRNPFQLHRSGWLFWLLVLLPVAGLAGLFAWRRVRSKLDEDTESRRRRQARGRARRRFKIATSYLKAGDRVGFFGEIANVIQEHLSARLGVRVQGLTLGDLRDVLQERGMAEDLQERVLRDLETCDFARFAPAASGEEEMEDSLDRARDLVVEIDRAKIDDQRSEA